MRVQIFSGAEEYAKRCANQFLENPRIRLVDLRVTVYQPADVNTMHKLVLVLLYELLEEVR